MRLSILWSATHQTTRSPFYIRGFVNRWLPHLTSFLVEAEEIFADGKQSMELLIVSL